MWRDKIREEWDNKCAYCESENNLTIDHIIPQSKGGMDVTENVVCCCYSCNQSKGHRSWEEWYSSQDFFDFKKYEKILKWIKDHNRSSTILYQYKPRKNYLS
jgi:CRISPR/Cas system Type II protein with McrA/HNH and RuvC-like nuclease domain